MARIFSSIILITLSAITFAGWTNLNTGINDNFTGISFIGTYGMVSGAKGIYYTLNGGNGPSSWSRFNIHNNAADSAIYNHTQFHHAYSNPGSTAKKFYFCGKDTVTGKATIMLVNLPDSSYTILYTGPANSSLNKIGYSSSVSYFYAVGDNGLVVKFNSTSATVIPTSISNNLNSVSLFGTNFRMGANNAVLYGTFSSNAFTFQTSASAYNFKDVLCTSSSQGYGVGSTYYSLNGGSATNLNIYDQGPLDAECIFLRSSNQYIGTDHGIFKSGTSLNYFEWQPTSGNYTIRAFYYTSSIFQDFYACGDNGVVLYTTDNGGTTKPFAKLNSPGGCAGSSIPFNGTTGTATTCNWFVNNVQTNSNECSGAVTHLYSSPGQYDLKLIVYNNVNGLSDTATQTITVVSVPQINKTISLSKSILCHQESIQITINASEPNVYYNLKMFGNNTTYGSSGNGNGSSITFTTQPLNTTGKYYLQAQNASMPCSKNFTDTIKITVEQTDAHFHSGTVNAIAGEPVTFFQNCTDAQNYQWTFPANASTLTSNLPIIQNSFSSVGSTSIRLICWSNNGCYDTIHLRGPFIYQEPLIQDSCWTIINNGIDTTYYDLTLAPDISQISNSSSGFLACGAFTKESFASHYGDSLQLPVSNGGYMAKYKSNGVLKWMVHTRLYGNIDEREYIISTIEDKNGDIYISGFSEGSFFDNTGDSITIPQRNASVTPDKVFLIKLDQNGKLIWKLTNPHVGLIDLAIDNSNNLYGWYELTPLTSNIPFLLNNDTSYILPNSTLSNFGILKINPSGNILWNAGIDMKHTNRASIEKICIDKANNIYFTGTFEKVSKFYSAGSNTPNNLNTYNSLNRKAFLAKYDSSGVYKWAIRAYTKSTGNPNEEQTFAMGMDIDDNGNSYITGENFYGGLPDTMVFENTNSTTTTIPAHGYFVAKVNTNGVCNWLQGNTGNYSGAGYLLTKLGNEITTIGQLASYNTDTTTGTLTSSNHIGITLHLHCNDYFVATYDTLGNLVKILTNGSNTECPFIGGIIDRILDFRSLFRKNDKSYYFGRTVDNGDAVGTHYMNFGTDIISKKGMKGWITRFVDTCGIIYYPNTIITHTTYTSGNSIKIYPNPANDFLMIEGYNNLRDLRVTLYDLLGKEILKTANKDRIYINNLPKGLYYITIFDKDMPSYTSKIIKN